MSNIDLPPQADSLIARVKNILLKPKDEWAVIDAEQTSIQKLYLGYILILAAIPVVATLIGSLVFGYGAFGVTYRPTLMGALTTAVSSYVLSLVGVAVLALVIEFLAPQFGGQKDRIQAFKVAAYAMTAAWVAGIVTILPALAIVAALGGLYGLYLLYLGLPVLMKAPADKALTYTIVVIVVAIVVNIVLAAVAGAVSGMGGAGIYADRGSVSGAVSVPGYGSVDVGKAEAAAKAADAAIERALAAAPAATNVAAVGADQLSALLPPRVDGFARGEVSSSSSEAGGLNTSMARATYTAGEGSVDLSVTDMGGAAAFAQLGAAFDVSHSEAAGTRYEKFGKVGGRLTKEQYDSTARSGEYSVVVAERFMVEANGRNVDMAVLKAAVNSVGFSRLEGLARGA